MERTPKSAQEKTVSFNPTSFVKVKDDEFDLAKVHKFRPEGEREDYLMLTVPTYVKLALETLGLAGRTTSGKAAQWSLRQGLGRLEPLAEVGIICSARAVILRAGSADIDQLDWAYRVAPRNGSERLFLRKVSPSDAGRCSDLAKGLGLPVSTLGAVAVMSGIVDAPLPGDTPRLLLLELQEFARGLRRRAELAEELGRRASAVPQQPSPPNQWADVWKD